MSATEFEIMDVRCLALVVYELENKNEADERLKLEGGQELEASLGYKLNSRPFGAA